MAFWSNLFSRPALPPLYSDGWQAGLGVYGDTKKGSISGIASLNSALRILNGQLCATPLMVFSGAEELPDSDVAMCLKRTRASNFEACYADALVSGNGWMRIDRENNRLVHVQAFRMSAELRQTAPEYTVQYLCDGQPIVYDDFIHIMLRNSYSSFLGESLIAQNDQSVANIMAVFWLQNQLQSNGSHVDMFLTTDMSFNAEQMSRLRTSYNEQASNLGKSGGTVILSSGLKPEIVKKLPSALESDLIKSLDWTTTEISRMTGVPLTYLAMPESSNYGSAVESSRAFFITTMNPMFHKIAEEFSYKLGADIRFDTSETTMGMGQERAEILSKLLYSGTISPNEARASLGFSPVPYGDVTGMPQNTLPLDAWIDTQPNQAKQAPAEKSISNRKALESFRSLIGI